MVEFSLLTLPHLVAHKLDVSAARFLTRLESLSPTKPRTGKNIADAPTERIITEIPAADILSFEVTGQVDGFGTPTSKCFSHNGLLIALTGSSYREFEQFCVEVSKIGKLHRFLSHKFILDTSFEWLRIRHLTPTLEVPYSTYLLEVANSAIKVHRIAIPIAGIEADGPFDLGVVRFAKLGSAFFDNLESNWGATDTSANRRTAGGLQPLRKSYQGHLCGWISYRAERERAVQIAVIQVECALEVLRFFYAPFKFVECAMPLSQMGHEFHPITHAIVDCPQDPAIVKRSETGMMANIQVSLPAILDFSRLGFGIAAKYIYSDSAPSLWRAWRRALTFVSRACRTRLIQDKLVYWLAAGETLFLGKGDAKIQDTLALRVAMIASQSIEGRREIREHIKSAYSKRSSFVHRGSATINDSTVADAEAAMADIWTAMVNVLLALDELKTQGALIQYLDDKILS